MKTLRPALVLLVTLTALPGCAPTVSNDPKVNGGETAAGDESDKPDEETPQPSVAVAVGSVLLESDCPDPPTAGSSIPASIAPSMAPAKPAKRSPAASAPASVPPMPGDSVAPPRRRRCKQSTLQITFENSAEAPAKVRVVEVRLRDVKTDQEVATLPSRMPSKWSEADNAYADWNEDLAAASSARASYRIKPPSWSAVEAKLDGEASRGRTYSVEVSVEIGGVATTARSAEFTRPPIVPMPPT